ncbi:conserved Plasmodium protein, unknown function [Plasmodium relictum]|uniref:Clp1 P-loop domain-containing protein n=1 Tax=Plasmodium relictum TaxID=85471 RepID=A0A1J1H8X2_PLARL|nr:conserved Plasmodium protein, unknown function [Plasmodium relictum]CRG99896.1 conserved Plasmodium protein, unknown function [Plasmodium relictum]
MFDIVNDKNCVNDFEYNLIKSYDTIEKVKNKEDNIYIHTKTYNEHFFNEKEKKIFKKKVYLLGLNYNEYIFIRGNFRFRLIKGLIKFNGEILKPSKEYINVRIPVFYPSFKLIALNVNNIKYVDKKFIFHKNVSISYDDKESFICNENKSSNIKNKELNTNNLEELEMYDNTTILTKNKDIIGNSNFNISSEGNEFLCEYADTIIKNYIFGLNLLPEENMKKKMFYEYLMFSNKEDINMFSSYYMTNSITSNIHFAKYPIIIAFQRKKDFLYYLYNNDASKKLNISNYRQNYNFYINTYQFSYALKEFLLYIHNNKKYELGKVIERVEDINNSYISYDNIIDDNNNNNNDYTENYLMKNDSRNDKYKENKCSNNFTKEELFSNRFRFREYFKKYIYNENISEDNYCLEEKCSYMPNIFSVIIMGDKNKGKSFLVINFINNLLNYYKSVILLDVDIGQPIIGTSGFLSIYKIKYSLNNYNFFEKKNKCIKKIFYGCCSINENINFYIKCLEYIYNYLFSEYLKKKKKKKKYICNYPLIINTFGWIKNIGLFLLHLNIFLSKCDFVIQIDSLKINKNLKGKIKNKEYYSYMFNDFLLINQDEKNRVILNLNNKNISIISKRYSIFNAIRKYNNLNENNFFFFNFSMSFQSDEENKEIKKECSSNYNMGKFSKCCDKANLNEFRNSDNIRTSTNNLNYNSYNNNYYNNNHIDYGYNNYKRYNNNYNNVDTPCSLNNYMYKMKHLKYNENVLYSSFNSTERYTNNKSLIQKTNYSEINRTNYERVNNYTLENNKNYLIQGNENEMKDYEKYEYFKEIMNYFLEKKYIRVINFISYKKILSYESMKINNSRSKNFSVLPKNLRSYRFFSYFFYKFKKIIFYIHSYSLYDRLNDFFIKHKNYVRYINTYTNEDSVFDNRVIKGKDIIDNMKDIYFNENEKEGINNKEDLSKCNNIHKDKTIDISNINLNKKDVTDNDSTPNYNLQIKKIQKDENNEEIKKRRINQNTNQIHRISCNLSLFTCAIFYLKNIKLSNILFNDENPEFFNENIFFAYKYFFNNIICLCNDSSEEKVDFSGINENNKITYYIDYLEIDKTFENLNYNIEKINLKRNNVQLVPISEKFTHILTAYVKAIDSMQLIIYLPYWFGKFHLLNNVNTFVSGHSVVPYNISDMIDNYSFYMDIVNCKKSETIKLLKKNKTSENISLNLSI